jgi:dephospho-CoA kinase
MGVDGKQALALVGMPGAGKSTCAAHLVRRGLVQFRFGSIVTSEVTKRGLPLTPANERMIREEFRAHEGMDAIARRALHHLRHLLDDHPLIVIDGLYSFSEYTMLHRELPARLVVVAIVSDRDIRYGRLASRPERPLSRQEAITRDIAEIENLEKGGPIAIADYTLLNNEGPAQLTAALDALLDKLMA